MWKKSIFNNITVNNNFAYIHFPLIYKTNNQLYIELYTKALIKFIELLGLKNKVYCKINGFLVVELLPSEINIIHNEALNKFYDIDFFKKIKKRLDVIYKKAPEYIEEFENLTANKKRISVKLLEKIFNIFVYLLAVNNFSFIPETLLSEHLSKSQNKDNELFYITKDIFSHIKYFSLEKSKIPFDIKSNRDKNRIKILSFCKNTAFLENELGDMTRFEDIEYITKLLKISNIDSITPLIQAEYLYPKIMCDISQEDYSQYPIIILWAKLLQVNLEYRHYWLLRLLRNLRIYCDYNFDIINNWIYKDYAKQIFKIK